MHNTLTTLTARQAKAHPQRIALAACVSADAPLTAINWLTLHERASDVARALVRLGVAPQERVAIFCENCTEAITTELGAFMARIVPVSIYATSQHDQVKYIAGDADVKVIFAGNTSQYHIAARVASESKTPVQVVVYPGVETFSHDGTTLTWDAFLALGRDATPQVDAEVRTRTAAATPDDVATLIYTSGTTGEPKGAILPHSCFDAAFEIHRERLTMVSSADTSLSFLPLSHIFEKAWTYYCLDMSIQVTVNRDPKEIQRVIRRVRPTCMCAVPRFWEKAYMAIQEQIARAGAIKRALARRAIAVGRRRNLDYVRLGKPVPAILERQYRFYDKRVFAPVRRAMGIDRGNIFPTAGAPLAPDVTAFFHSIGVNVLIGYGLSETTATVSCYPQVDYIIGSVGTVMPRLQVRIGPENEIEVKGPTVMRGYLNKPEETANAFTPDGWFRTGDAGNFDKEGALVLTERIKDLFKTSNGKYIAPQMLESRLGSDPYIEQVAVIGDKRKYVTAIIIPAFDALRDYARRKHIAYSSLEELVRNADVKRMIGDRIERLQQGLPGFERIKKFTLLPRAFTMESGELTNTLKLRRPVINARYAGEIEAMYAQ